jgi:hypothetical protein
LGFALGRYHSAVWSDELDANGDAYWVWSDGQLYDMEEGALYAQWQAQHVLPDFEPETQTAATQQWGLPIRLGLDWQVSDAWTMEASGCMIMGMQPALAQIAAPNTQALTMFSIGIGWRPGSTLFQDPAIPREYLARRRDSDGDGVTDFRDACFSTPEGVAVDATGCPVDSDEDGVADHLDLEANSVGAVDLQGRQVNLNGPVPSFPATVPPTHLDFKQVVAEPSTGRRPHLPIGQAFEAPALQPIDNR